MEGGRGKGVGSAERWNFALSLRVYYMCLLFSFVTLGVRQTCAGPVYVTETPFRRYFITEETFKYGFDNRTFQAACANIGAQMAVIEENAEFLHIQDVFPNVNGAVNIFLDIRRSGNSVRYYWATEEVNSDLWAANQPNDIDIHADAVCKASLLKCMRAGLYRRPNRVKPELFDFCCTRYFKGLCAQDNDNYCSSHGSCPPNATCTLGTSACSCLPGYKQTWNACRDVDECSEPDLYPCRKNSYCANTPGSYRCPCRGGFIHSDGVCEDVNECEKPDLYPCPENSFCVNTNGNFTCHCDAGFTILGNVCEDIDECENTTLFDCPAHSTCVNQEGNYTCDCDLGYTNHSDLCVDIDECENTTLFDCPEHSTCVNLEGSYTCDCDLGYTKENDFCIDVDECENATLFQCPELSNCNNTDGGYTCICQDGYFTNGRGLCEKIDNEGFKLRTCPCECPKTVVELAKNLSKIMNNSEALKEKSETITKKLEVKTTNLTTAVRTKTSATDERPSSASFGVIALTLLGLELFLITLGDIIVVALYIKQKLVNLFCPTAGLDER